VRSWWRGTGLVVGRELHVGFRRRSFLVTIAALLLVGLAVAVLPRLLADTGMPSYDLAVSGEAPRGFRDALAGAAEALGIEIETDVVGSAADASLAVAAGDVDASLVWTPSASPLDAAPPRLLHPDGASPNLLGAVANAAVVSSTIERLEAVGVSAAEAPSVLAGPPVAETVETTSSSDEAGLGYAVAFALYLFLLTTGTQVATGVAVEKSNRIAESLLATLRASQLLAGKVVGIGVLGLVALVAVAAPVLVSLAVGGDIEVPDGAAGQIAAGLGWFLLGYAMYACAFACLGALVDRQEEVGGAVMPLTIAMIGGFFLAIEAQGSPDSPLAVVASLVPLTAPMVMPMRTALGAAAAYEVALAVVGTAATAVLLNRFGGGVYRRAMIRTGRRLKLREVLRG
jgi:ABC-2 type transport system permease protein